MLNLVTEKCIFILPYNWSNRNYRYPTGLEYSVYFTVIEHIEWSKTYFKIGCTKFVFNWFYEYS